MLNYHCPLLALRKLVLPLSAYHSLTYTLRKNDSTPHHRHLSHLGSTLELTMMQVSQGMRVTELTLPPFVCHTVVWVTERSFPHPCLPIATCIRQES